ncbi:hypothetical protein [Pedobacter sp.]|uniref:glycosyl-4,4'-diaponeurosporenoate acyltransferase CrtO family protein n=1 Tax=Pedobacter sp. TaxID=1411316 RepID=UPI003D7F7E52
MIKYITFSLFIGYISWLIGMIITSLLSKSEFYQQQLSSLNFIKDEKVNEMLGLEPFKWVIMNSFFKYLNPKLSIQKRIFMSELREYRSEMTKAEFNHNFAFLFMGIFILIKVFQGFYIFAIVMLLVNILINLYPILLQQQNKRRIDRYLQLMNQRSLQNLTR